MGRAVRVQDSVGHNALLEAVKRGHDPLIRLLVDNGSKCGPPSCMQCSVS